MPKQALKGKYWIWIGLLLVLALAACSEATPIVSSAATESVPTSRPTEVSPEPTTVETTAGEAEMAAEQQVDYCLECHSDKQRLIDSASPKEAASESIGQLLPEVVQMEPWEKVLVNGDTFPGSIHGLNGCIDCHGGVQTPEKDEAHQGAVRNPSAESAAVCGACHPDVVGHYQTALHNTLAGFWTELDARSVPANHDQLAFAFENSCQSCHTTCGDCHVSHPNAIGGGFVDGHIFERTPSMEQNCAACHSLLVGNEYLGHNDGLEADVHFRQGEMTCTNCHDGADLHGQEASCQNCHEGPESNRMPPADHFYAGVQSPRCETCHTRVSSAEDDNLMHQMHGSKLSCQVCHSVAYTSFDDGQIVVDEETRATSFEIEGAQLTFLIGRNPYRNYERPYEYVPVRHIPISADTFEYYGKNLLPNFNALETWTYATPHNIQRNTPQTESCAACHDNPDLFLTADKVAPEELEANKWVIVENVPPAISSAEQIPPVR